MIKSCFHLFFLRCWFKFHFIKWFRKHKLNKTKQIVLSWQSVQTGYFQLFTPMTDTNINFIHVSNIKSELCALVVKLSLSLYSLSLRESWHYNHSVPHHRKLFKHLEMTYTQVWYIIGIVSSSLTSFHLENIGLIRVTTYLPCQ